MTGPCEWALSYAECSDTAILEGLGADEVARIEAMAVDYLWRWTGRQFGTCQVLLRPCRAECADRRTTWGTPNTMLGGGGGGGGLRRWIDFQCGCGKTCDCRETSKTLRLPGVVSDVASVTVDGAVLDPGAYRVDNHRLLVRIDGGDWPTCQDLSVAPTEVGTWEVDLTLGVPVPVGGQIAAGVLAAEFAKALCNDVSCRLPQRVQSITRQGVTMAVLDSFEDLNKGRTGIWLIDSWVASVMSYHPPSGVYSVDVPRDRTRRTTWPTLVLP